MIRTIAVFFACLIAASAQKPGLKLTIGTEQVSPGIEGLPRRLTAISLTIANPNDSPQLLVVGTYFNNVEYWNITANLTLRDGRITPLVRVPPQTDLIGSAGPVVVEVPAHGSYRELLDAGNFEEVYGNDRMGLAAIIGGSGDQLQIVVHCGETRFAPILTGGVPWKGDLVSDWLKI